MLFKNPVYFMQCVLPAVIMPILLPLVFFMGSADLSELQGEDINNSGGLCIIIGIICFMLSHSISSSLVIAIIIGLFNDFSLLRFDKMLAKKHFISQLPSPKILSFSILAGRLLFSLTVSMCPQSSIGEQSCSSQLI